MSYSHNCDRCLSAVNCLQVTYLRPHYKQLLISDIVRTFDDHVLGWFSPSVITLGENPASMLIGAETQLE